ncbi:MAG: hypothetical protein H8E64_07355 [Candidatus Marinimicrobia bacterium]|nr:hypothetical protein [Candidatus Neomarinimicrobiota bacterium]
MSKEKQNHDIHFLEGWAFTRVNYLLFGFGLLLIIFGYIVMATGSVNSFQSLTLAPVMLFAGYIVLIPLALIVQKKKDTPS